MVAGIDELGAQAEGAQVRRDDPPRQSLAERGDQVERTPAQLAQQEDAVADSLELGEQRLQIALETAGPAAREPQQTRLPPVTPVQAVETLADFARQPRDRPFRQGDQVVRDPRHGRHHNDRPRARESLDDRADLPDLRGALERRSAEFHDNHRVDLLSGE